MISDSIMRKDSGEQITRKYLEERPLTTAENVTMLGFNSGASKRMNAPLLPICQDAHQVTYKSTRDFKVVTERSKTSSHNQMQPPPPPPQKKKKVPQKKKKKDRSGENS